MFNKADYLGKPVKTKKMGRIGIITDAVKWNGRLIFWVKFGGWTKSYYGEEVEIL